MAGGPHICRGVRLPPPTNFGLLNCGGSLCRIDRLETPKDLPLHSGQGLGWLGAH